ncbi:nitroreductase/quinone reductase family protein [Actinoplanes xinjiangensis]|uniref:nitroreductase/quinone reductase family protein n=1 Tax=Actinoplanes xinjiangensis TaxID=512350 RepID=UPI00344276C0
MSLSRRWRRWMYRGARPNRLARLLNRIAGVQHSTGFLGPPGWVVLEVTGRVSGRTVGFPLVIADHDGERYLVSMLGENANWVANVRAANGEAVLRHGRRRQVRLVELPVAERAPILRRYLAVAPGARAHFPVHPQQPLAQFEAIAAGYPVFRITTSPGH